MQYIEDKLNGITKFGLYLLLTVVSGTIGFLGYRVGGKLSQGEAVNIFELAHADAPPVGDDVITGDGVPVGDGGASVGASGNGSDFANGFDGYSS